MRGQALQRTGTLLICYGVETANVALRSRGSCFLLEAVVGFYCDLAAAWIQSFLYSAFQSFSPLEISAPLFTAFFLCLMVKIMQEEKLVQSVPSIVDDPYLIF